MVQKIVDLRDVQFLLHEVFQAAEILGKNKLYKEFSQKNILDMIIKEARNFAIKELLPANTIGDRQDVIFNSGKITVPDEFKHIYNLYIQ